ncbi:MAG: hypothetical protein A4E66_01427 [Syntrophus sp. PtaB.Bin001]|nr:MAG: hypothetical protein A4E66_01427 [Syntrophus sp. PtaB.Bin001]
MTDTVMLNDNKISRRRVGNGIIITIRMPITPRAIIALLLPAKSENFILLASVRMII